MLSKQDHPIADHPLPGPPDRTSHPDITGRTEPVSPVGRTARPSARRGGSL
ncbi:hypothetical protein [Streptomyces sp. NPDC040750]|uniref:hypothetical protein n=1 Tax=Streptomyces sp. NPDC040750 TaxID=3154491 RepID=UPI0033DB0978